MSSTSSIHNNNADQRQTKENNNNSNNNLPSAARDESSSLNNTAGSNLTLPPLTSSATPELSPTLPPSSAMSSGSSPRSQRKPRVSFKYNENSFSKDEPPPSVWNSNNNNSSNNTNNQNNNNTTSHTQARRTSATNSSSNSHNNSFTEHPLLGASGHHNHNHPPSHQPLGRNPSFSHSPIKTRDEILNDAKKRREGATTKNKTCGFIPPKIRNRIKQFFKWLASLNYVAVLLTFSACCCLASAILLFLIGADTRIETDLTVTVTTTTMNVTWNPNYNASDPSSSAQNYQILSQNFTPMFFQDVRLPSGNNNLIVYNNNKQVASSSCSWRNNNNNNDTTETSNSYSDDISFYDSLLGIHSSPEPEVISQHSNYNITRMTNFSNAEYKKRTAGVITFAQALFVAVSGYTATGLSTVDYSHWNGPTMSVVGGIITLGSIVLLTTLPAILRYKALIQERKKLIQILLSTGAYDDDEEDEYYGEEEYLENHENENHHQNPEELLLGDGGDGNNNNNNSINNQEEGGYVSPNLNNTFASLEGTSSSDQQQQQTKPLPKFVRRSNSEKKNEPPKARKPFVFDDENFDVNNNEIDEPLNSKTSLRTDIHDDHDDLLGSNNNNNNNDTDDTNSSPTYSVTEKDEQRIGLVFVDSSGDTMRIPYPKNHFKNNNNKNKTHMEDDDDDDENLELLGIRSPATEHETTNGAATSIGGVPPPSSLRVPSFETKSFNVSTSSHPSTLQPQISNSSYHTNTSSNDNNNNNQNVFDDDDDLLFPRQNSNSTQSPRTNNLTTLSPTSLSPAQKNSPNPSENGSLARSQSPQTLQKQTNNNNNPHTSPTASPNLRSASPPSNNSNLKSSMLMASTRSDNPPKSPMANGEGNLNNKKSSLSDRQRANTILNYGLTNLNASFGRSQMGASSNKNNNNTTTSPKDNMNASNIRNQSPQSSKRRAGSGGPLSNGLEKESTMPFISLTEDSPASNSSVKVAASTKAASPTSLHGENSNTHQLNIISGGNSLNTSPTTANENNTTSNKNQNAPRVPLSNELQDTSESTNANSGLLLFAPPATAAAATSSSEDTTKSNSGGSSKERNSSENILKNSNDEKKNPNDDGENNKNNGEKKKNKNGDDDDDIPEGSSITFGQRIVYEDGLAHVNQQIDICLIIIFGAIFYWLFIHLFFTVLIWAAAPSDDWTFGFTLFHVISAFNNAGFAKPYITEVTAAPFVMVCFIIVMIIGNALFPIMFRLMLSSFHYCMKKYTEEKKVIDTAGGATSSPLLLTEQQEKEKEKSQLRKAKFIFGQPIQVWQHSLWLFLRYPRRYYTHMFNTRASLILFSVWMAMTVIGMLLMVPEMVNEYVLPDVAGNQDYKFLIALFQTVSVRTTGFAVVKVDRLTTGHLTWWVLAMYLSAYPFILTVRSSSGRRSEGAVTDNEQNEKKVDTVTDTKKEGEKEGQSEKDGEETKSSDDGKKKKSGGRGADATSSSSSSDSDDYDPNFLSDDDDDNSSTDSDDEEYFKNLSGVASSVVKEEATNVMARDLLWLYLAILIISYCEQTSNIEETADHDYSLYLRTVFEVISSFGNVGLSLSIPNSVPEGSFSATFQNALSPLVLIMVMYFGKHRNLPQSVDEAIAIHVRKYEFTGELNPDEDVRGTADGTTTLATRSTASAYGSGDYSSGDYHDENSPSNIMAQEMQSFSNSHRGDNNNNNSATLNSGSLNSHRSFHYSASFIIPSLAAKETQSHNGDDTDDHHHSPLRQVNSFFSSSRHPHHGDDVGNDEEHAKKLQARLQRRAIASEKRRQEYRRRVEAFYEHYNPVRLMQVERIISAFESNPKALLRNLEATYGPEPNKKKFMKQQQKQKGSSSNNNHHHDHHHHHHHHHNNKRRSSTAPGHHNHHHHHAKRRQSSMSSSIRRPSNPNLHHQQQQQRRPSAMSEMAESSNMFSRDVRDLV